MRRACWILACPALMALSCEQQPPPPSSARPIARPAPLPRDEQLDAHVARLRPRPHEQKYMQIPWRTNLLAARHEAQAAGKPIFLWLMDGNPLGLV